MRWTRGHEGYTAEGHGRMGHIIQVLDNGGGRGPAKGAGRWAVVVDGDWIANIDLLDDAKAAALHEADERVEATAPDNYVPDCEDCGEPIDYCQGHGVM